MIGSDVIERFTDLSGVRIRYLDSRPSDCRGLPILLSPGFTDFADEYADVLAFFAPRRVLVVEVRGRGGSEAPGRGYSATDHAADLRAVLDQEAVDRFHLMTFSRGTTWGLDLVLAEPRRVGCVAIGDYWAREKRLPIEVADEVMASRFRGMPMTDRISPHVVRGMFEASHDRDLCDELAAVGLPVLVATGTEPGCMLTPDDLQEYRDRVADIEFVTVDGASHDLFRPDRLAYPRAVNAFIERRLPGT